MKKLISIITTVALMGTLLAGCMDGIKDVMGNKGGIKEGDTYAIDHLFETQYSTKIMGQDIVTKGESEVGTELKVNSIKNGEKAYEYKINKEMSSSDITGELIKINTEDGSKEGDEFKSRLNALNINIVTDKEGEIKSYEQSENLDLGSVINLDIIKEYLQDIFTFAAVDGRASVGEEWEVSEEIDLDDEIIKFKEKFRITGIEKEKLYIESVITSNFTDGEGKEIEISGKGDYILIKNDLPVKLAQDISVILKNTDIGNGSKCDLNINLRYRAYVEKKK